MARELTTEEMNGILFTNLVLMLGSSAMQQMGKLVNPVTNKTEVQLEAAQVTIDMVAMLKERTRGNLNKEEEKMISDLLASLQINYVETSRSAPAGDHAKKEDTGDPGKPEEQVEETPPVQKGAGKKDPKFHKSYGG